MHLDQSKPFCRKIGFSAESAPCCGALHSCARWSCDLFQRHNALGPALIFLQLAMVCGMMGGACLCRVRWRDGKTGGFFASPALHVRGALESVTFFKVKTL